MIPLSLDQICSFLRLGMGFGLVAMGFLMVLVTYVLALYLICYVMGKVPSPWSFNRQSNKEVRPKGLLRR